MQTQYTEIVIEFNIAAKEALSTHISLREKSMKSYKCMWLWASRCLCV